MLAAAHATMLSAALVAATPPPLPTHNLDRHPSHPPPAPLCRPQVASMTLQSSLVDARTQFAMGFVEDNRLTLLPIDQALQLRPSLAYLDKEREDKKKAAAAAAGGGASGSRAAGADPAAMEEDKSSVAELMPVTVQVGGRVGGHTPYVWGGVGEWWGGMAPRCQGRLACAGGTHMCHACQRSHPEAAGAVEVGQGGRRPGMPPACPHWRLVGSRHCYCTSARWPRTGAWGQRPLLRCAQVKRRETEQQQEARLRSYAYLAQQEEQDTWVPLQYHAHNSEVRAPRPDR